MNPPPPPRFDATREPFDLEGLRRFLQHHLGQLGELGISAGVPRSVLALNRLARVSRQFGTQVFWQYSDQALREALALAQAAASVAPEDDARALVAAQVRENQQRQSARNGVLYVLRQTGHPDEADEAEDLWRHDHGNEPRRQALEDRVGSEGFHACTAAFVRQHAADLDLLQRLTDRSGPASTHRPTGQAAARVRSIDAVSLRVGGASAERQLPFEAVYTSPWQISHPCGCVGSPLAFSRLPHHNWHYITRLFDRFYTLDALQTIDALLSSVRLFKPDRSPYTFLTDTHFGDANAAVYAIPQVRLNHYFCSRCHSEFLCRITEGLPQQPSREYPQGLPGKISVAELIEFQSPGGGSFLNYLDERLLKPG